MWLWREKDSFGEAWHPHSKVAAGETGQRDASTEQQNRSRAGAGECSIRSETLGAGRVQLPQPGVAPRAS